MSLKRVWERVAWNEWGNKTGLNPNEGDGGKIRRRKVQEIGTSKGGLDIPLPLPLSSPKPKNLLKTRPNGRVRSDSPNPGNQKVPSNSLNSGYNQISNRKKTESFFVLCEKKRGGDRKLQGLYVWV